jgi:predicted nucleic acid-binding protein
MTAKSELQFVDTNILVYAYDTSTGEKRQKAKPLITDLWHDRNGCVSLQVLQELHVTLTHKIPRPIDLDTSYQIIQDLTAWQVYMPDAQDVISAIRIQEKYMLSFWEAMIVRSAQQTGCKILWSEDLTHEAEYEGVKVLNPFKASIPT